MFVDVNGGSDNSTCGRPSAPCKSLQVAINKSSHDSTIIVSGNPILDETINLDRSLTIIASNNQTSITQQNKSLNIHAFTTTTGLLNLTFISLKFEGIGFIYMNKTPKKIEIHKCRFNGLKSIKHSPSPLIKSAPSAHLPNSSTIFHVDGSIFKDLKNIFGGIIPFSIFTLRNSVFNNIHEIALKYSTKLLFLGTKFRNVFRIYIQGSKTAGSMIKSCDFNHVSDILILSDFERRTLTLLTLLAVEQIVQFDNCEFFDSHLSTKCLKTLLLKNCHFNGRKSKMSTTFGWNLYVTDTLWHNSTQSSILEISYYCNVLITKSIFEFNNGGIEARDVITLDDNRSYKQIDFTKFTYGSIQYNFAIQNSKFQSNNWIYNGFYGSRLGNVLVRNSQFYSNEKTSLYFSNSVGTVVNCQFNKNKGYEGGAIRSEESNINVDYSNFIANSAGLVGGAIRTSNCNGKFVRITNSLFEMCSAYAGGSLAITDDCKLFVNECEFRENSARTVGSGIQIMPGSKSRLPTVIENSKFMNNSASALDITVNNLTLKNTTIKSTTHSLTSQIYLETNYLFIDLLHTELIYPNLTQSNIVQEFFLFKTGKNKTNIRNLKIFCSDYFDARINMKQMVDSAMFAIDAKCTTCGPGNYTLRKTDQIKNFTKKFDGSQNGCKPCPSGTICNGNIKVLDEYWGTKKTDDEFSVLPCPRGYCCSSPSNPCVAYNTCMEGRDGTLCGRCKSGYMQSFLTDECIPESENGCDLHLFIWYFLITSWIYTCVFTFLPALFEKTKRIRCRKSVQNEVGIIDGPSVDYEKVPLAAVFTQIIFFFQLASLVHIEVHGKKDGSKENKAITKVLLDAFNFRFSVYREVCPAKDISLVTKLFISLGLKASTLMNIGFSFVLYKLSGFWNCKTMDENIALRIRNNSELSSTNKYPQKNIKAQDIDDQELSSKLNRIIVENIEDQDVFDLADLTDSELSSTNKYPQKNIKVQDIDDQESSSNPNRIIVENIEDQDVFDLTELGAENKTDETDELSFNDVEEKILLKSQLKIGFMKLIKINFTSTALILLQLVHCEEIHDQLHLYVYADHLCYAWWQWSIIVVFIPITIMVPMSFSMALNRLKERKISSKMFLVSCVVPLAFYLIEIYNISIPRGIVSSDNKLNDGNEEEENSVRAILEIEEELFDGESNGIRWSVVQLYRMLVVVLIDTVVLNPAYKSLWFSAIFVAFFVHDWYRLPYKHVYLNNLQRLTSICLFLVNLCSVPSSFSSAGNIMSIPHMDTCLSVLKYFESFIYFIVLVSPLMWKLKEKCENREKES